jgi:hypothetical protein
MSASWSTSVRVLSSLVLFACAAFATMLMDQEAREELEAKAHDLFSGERP